MTLETVALRFAEFRRALRERDSVAFDRLIDRARQHSSAASYEASLDPSEVLFLSIILDQEMEIARLLRAVDELSWAVLGHPAASAGTLDAYVPEREPSAGQPAPLGLAARIMGDYVDPRGRGWQGFLMAKPARAPTDAPGQNPENRGGNTAGAPSSDAP
jgi:hypothetical protein